jgi:hypothetical protein
MFLRFPFQFSYRLQDIALVLNTVLLVGVLIVAELAYSEAPKETRKYLRYFYPLVLVLVGILIFAAFKQIGKP